MSAHKKHHPFARAPYALPPRAYMPPLLIAIFISASFFFVYQASLIAGYMRIVDVAGQVQGDSYRATSALTLYEWDILAEWFKDTGRKADFLKNAYIKIEK